MKVAAPETDARTDFNAGGVAAVAAEARAGVASGSANESTSATLAATALIIFSGWLIPLSFVGLSSGGPAGQTFTATR
jgi:hypothetical protein